MLIRLRQHAGPIALALLASLVLLGGGLGSRHGAECHDAECRLLVVEHDESSHMLRGAGTGGDTHQLHCVACHWARSFRPSAGARVLSSPADEAGVPLHADLATAPRSASVAHPSLRSPPIAG